MSQKGYLSSYRLSMKLQKYVIELGAWLEA